MGTSSVNDQTGWCFENNEVLVVWSRGRSTPALHAFVSWGVLSSSVADEHNTTMAAASGTATQFRDSMPARIQTQWDAATSSFRAEFQAAMAAIWAAGGGRITA
jgi:hypothetical protein